ncbi:hypothetical protein HLRTI_000481 [Halorhabdus tiamatea SARL4B]|uniref:Uncharacterized protein n=1 Tax=Halorhabdus tiamatea SARL4B TaxID=1033806 RepID=F7PMI8_9EURY|nr:hypothetical protein [Halorhabdus tiamatea]ERJ07439.1 hypothetical protein HLRTI_000481 [Halorhabdus tiamatea SARL4B]
MTDSTTRARIEFADGVAQSFPDLVEQTLEESSFITTEWDGNDIVICEAESRPEEVTDGEPTEDVVDPVEVVSETFLEIDEGLLSGWQELEEGDRHSTVAFFEGGFVRDDEEILVWYGVPEDGDQWHWDGRDVSDEKFCVEYHADGAERIESDYFEDIEAVAECVTELLKNGEDAIKNRGEA